MGYSRKNPNWGVEDIETPEYFKLVTLLTLVENSRQNEASVSTPCPENVWNFSGSPTELGNCSYI